MEKRTIAFVELFLVALSWSSFFLFLKELEKEGVSPVNIVVGRMVIASLIMIVVALILKTKLPPLKDFALLSFPGLSFFAGAWLVARGAESQPPGITAFLQFAVPISISLFLLKKLDIKLTVIGVIALVMAVAGLLITAMGDTFTINISLGIIFLGAAFIGLYLISQKFLVKRYGPFMVTCFVFWGSLPLAAFFTPDFIKHVPGMSGEAWFMLMGMVIISSIVPFMLYNHAMKELGPVEGTAVNLIIPFLGSLVSFAFGGFDLSTEILIGGLVTFVGVGFFVAKGILRQDEVKG